MIDATCDVWNIDFKKNSNNINKNFSTGVRSSITRNRRQFSNYNTKTNCSTSIKSSLFYKDSNFQILKKVKVIELCNAMSNLT